MADLSTLDVTQPPDSQAVSQGAARIRETRAATVTSFGIEHALTGEHQLAHGATGTNPAAGHAGRLFIDTSRLRIQFDTGSAWVDISGGSTLSYVTAAVTANLTGITAATTICTLPALLCLGGRVQIGGTMGVHAIDLGGIPNDMLVQVLRGASIIYQVTFRTAADSSGFVPIPTPFLVDAPGAGSFTYSVKVTPSSNSFGTSANPGSMYAYEMA